MTSWFEIAKSLFTFAVVLWASSSQQRIWPAAMAAVSASQVWPWEYLVGYKQDIRKQDLFHQLAWHPCSPMQNTTFSNVLRAVHAARGQNGSLLLFYPVVFQRNHYSSSKYLLDDVGSLTAGLIGGRENESLECRIRRKLAPTGRRADQCGFQAGSHDFQPERQRAGRHRASQRLGNPGMHLP